MQVGLGSGNAASFWADEILPATPCRLSECKVHLVTATGHRVVSLYCRRGVAIFPTHPNITGTFTPNYVPERRNSENRSEKNKKGSDSSARGSDGRTRGPTICIRPGRSQKQLAKVTRTDTVTDSESRWASRTKNSHERTWWPCPRGAARTQAHQAGGQRQD